MNLNFHLCESDRLSSYLLLRDLAVELPRLPTFRRQGTTFPGVLHSYSKPVMTYVTFIWNEDRFLPQIFSSFQSPSRRSKQISGNTLKATHNLLPKLLIILLSIAFILILQLFLFRVQSLKSVFRHSITMD